MEHAPNAVDVHEPNQLGKPAIRKRADRNPERRVIGSVSLAAPNRVLPRIRDFLAGKPVLEGVPVYSDQCRSPFFLNKYTRLVYQIKAPAHRAPDEVRDSAAQVPRSPSSHNAPDNRARRGDEPESVDHRFLAEQGSARAAGVHKAPAARDIEERARRLAEAEDREHER